MFTIIILILVVAFAVGALKSMSAEERAIVIRRTINMVTFGTVYLFRASKAATIATYQSGRIAGSTLALEGQDTLDSMNDHNNEVASKGGATREAIRSSQSHAEALGFTDMNKTLKAKADALAAEVEAKREERLLRSAARKAAKAKV